MLNWFMRLLGVELRQTPKEPEVQTCTRRAPHVCAVNGPCNGWPKDGEPTYHGEWPAAEGANGRMPTHL